ncbi:MAG: hypothetical protein ACOH15_07275 [Acetobacterium sp.]
MKKYNAGNLYPNMKRTLYEDFMEKYPDALLYRPGRPVVCPSELGYEEKDLGLCGNLTCIECWARPKIEK